MTTTTLSQVVAAIQAKVATITLVDEAPTDLPGQLPPGTVVTCYPERGRQGALGSGGFSGELHTFAIEIWPNANDYAQACKIATSIMEQIIRLIESDPYIGNTVKTYRQWSYIMNAEKPSWTIKIEDCVLMHTW